MKIGGVSRLRTLKSQKYKKQGVTEFENKEAAGDTDDQENDDQEEDADDSEDGGDDEDETEVK